MGTETKTKKREGWIKNWQARKFNKPKFPRAPLPPFIPTSKVELASFDTIHTENTELPEILPSIQPESQSSLFAPTIPSKQAASSLSKALLEPTNQPKNTRFSVSNYDVTSREGSGQKSKQANTATSNDLKTSLLEKYSSARNNLVKPSRFITNNKGAGTKSEEALEQKPSVFSSGVPRGAKANVFKKYAGDKLSQADFERQILGVSTVTELSVKSMICVKGRCFNADDMSKMLS